MATSRRAIASSSSQGESVLEEGVHVEIQEDLPEASVGSFSRGQRMSELIERVRAGETEAVRALIQRGISPDDENAAGERPLVVAVQNHRLAVVRVLLELGASANLADGTGTVPLECALGHRAILLALLAAGADPNRGGKPPLVYLAAKYPLQLDALLSHGANPDAMTENFETALSFASDWGYLASVELLLAAGADPNLVDPDSGRSPLLFAAEQGRTEILVSLLDGGADPLLARKDEDPWSALECALRYGHAECATLLVERFPDLAAIGSRDPIALADDIGEDALATHLEALRWSAPHGNLRVRLRIHQEPSDVQRSPKGETLRRRVAVFVDFQNLGERALSIPTEEPDGFAWRLQGTAEVSPDSGRYESVEVDPTFGRMDVMTQGGWVSIAPGASHSYRASRVNSDADLDLVTHGWSSLGDDEHMVQDRHHLRGTYSLSAARASSDSPKDAWRGTLGLPARAIR